MKFFLAVALPPGIVAFLSAGLRVEIRKFVGHVVIVYLFRMKSHQVVIFFSVLILPICAYADPINWQLAVSRPEWQEHPYRYRTNAGLLDNLGFEVGEWACAVERPSEENAGDKKRSVTLSMSSVQCNLRSNPALKITMVVACTSPARVPGGNEDQSALILSFSEKEYEVRLSCSDKKFPNGMKTTF